MNHTPEPWEVDRESESLERVGVSSGDKLVCQCARWGLDEDLANAERIVACVNACAGLTDEQVARIPAMLADYELLCRKVDHKCTDEICPICDK